MSLNESLSSAVAEQTWTPLAPGPDALLEESKTSTLGSVNSHFSEEDFTPTSDVHSTKGEIKTYNVSTNVFVRTAKFFYNTFVETPAPWYYVDHCTYCSRTFHRLETSGEFAGLCPRHRHTDRVYSCDVPDYDSPEWRFLASDTMKDEIDYVYRDDRVQQVLDRRMRKNISSPKWQNSKKHNFRTHKQFEKKLNKRTSKYVAHSTDVRPSYFVSFHFFFIMFFLCLLINCHIPTFSDALTYYEPVSDTQLVIGSYIVIELKHVYAACLSVLLLWKLFGYFLQIVFYVCEKIILWKRFRRINRAGVFTSMECTKANFELIVKILVATDWSNNVKAISSILAIVQIFKPNATVHSQIEKLVHKFTYNDNFSAHSVEISAIVDTISKYHAHDDSDSERFTRMEKHWSTLINSDLGLGLSQIVVILVTCGFIPEIEWEASGIEIFALKKSRENVHVKDIYSAAKQIITSVVDGVTHYETTGKLEGFFSHDSLESRISHALSLYQQVLVGNLCSYTGGLSEEGYISELETLKFKVEQKMCDPRSSSEKFFFKTYLDKLNDTISAMATLNLQQQNQMTAFGVLFFGGSSVGKSWFATPMIKWLLEANGFEHEDQNVITFNVNSAFDDQMRNNTFGVLIDDIANRKPNQGGTARATSDIVIGLINSVSQAALKADLIEKGKVMKKPKIVLGTTNNRGLNADYESTNPGSVKRRFKYDVEFIVRPAYCMPNSGEINPDAVTRDFPGQQFPDVWDFVVYRTILLGGGGGKYESEIVKNQIGGEKHNMKQFMLFMRDESARHFSREQASLQLRNSDAHKACSGCKMPRECCYCDTFNAHSVVNDLYDNLFSRQQSLGCEEPVTARNLEDLRGAQDLLMQNPEIALMLRAQSSWKNGMIFNTLPRWVLKLWIMCGGSLKKFLLIMITLSLLLPYFCAMLPGIFPKFVSIFILTMEFWFIKDVSVSAIVETILANSADRAMRRAWRTLISRSARTSFMKKAAVYGSGIVFMLYLMKATKVTFDGHSIEPDSVEDATEAMTARNFWSIFRGVSNNVSGIRTSTMTTQQLCSRVQSNVVNVVVPMENGERSVGGFFVAKGYLVVPAHFTHNLPEHAVWQINRGNGRVEKVLVDLTECDKERQWVKIGTDCMLVRLTGVNHSRDIIDCFSTKSAGNGYTSANMLRRDTEGTLHVHHVFSMLRKKFKYSFKELCGIQGDGYIGNCEAQPQPGWCCSLLVSNVKKPSIVGYHIAGSDTSSETCIQSFTQADIRAGISELDTCCEYISIDQDEAYDAHMEDCTSHIIHPLCPTHNINNHLPIDVMGAVPGSGPRTMNVRKTPYHTAVCEEFDITDPYGIPKSTARVVDGELKSPWKNCINELERAQNLMPYTRLARAKKELVTEMSCKLKQYISAGGIARPLSIQEAINGIDGIRGLDGQKMSTAAGLKYGKTKQKHLVNDDYPYVYQQYVYDDINQAIKDLKSRKRIVNSLNSNLKDEPLKKTKVDEYRTRVFFSDELHVNTIIGMYFGPVMAYMMQHPKAAHSAIGLNAESHDWEFVLNYLLRKGEEKESSVTDCVALDFAAFDKTLPESLLKFSWSVMIALAEQMPGYSASDITLMRVIADEKTTPFIHLNGTLVQCNFNHTSGNGCTAQIGSIAGIMMLMIAFYELNDPDGCKCLKALDYIRSMHLGDDCTGTVLREDGITFDFISLQKVLTVYGVTITMPDKTSKPVPYSNILDEDFLKRMFRYCPKRDSYVGQLDVKSLYKSFLYYLPSDVEVTSVQLGQSLGSVLKEAALHDVTFFNKVNRFVRRVASEHNIHVVNLEKKYDDYVIDWAYDSGKRHLEYRLNKPKEYLSDLNARGMIPLHKQVKIFGKEIVEVDDIDVCEYEAHVGDLDFSVPSIKFRCLCRSVCCDRNVAESVISSKSDSQEKANISESEKNYGVVSIPAENTSTHSLLTEGRSQDGSLSLNSSDKEIKLTEHTNTQYKAHAEETVNFSFNDQAFSHDIAGGWDVSMNAANHKGMELGDFLNRPVKIANFTWDSGGLESSKFLSTINPWDEFLSNPTVSRKISNFKLLKGRLHVKFVINGSPFMYGKLAAFYHPLPGQDAFLPATTQRNICRLTQRQHIYMDPATSSGGEMTLPFFWQYNAINLPKAEWEQLGRIAVLPISQLHSVSGGTAEVNVSVFAWMEDTFLMQPTSTEVGIDKEFSGQASESSRKIVSKTATAVGDIAGALTTAPVIGPFARATEEVANKFGRFADLLGYSKPRGTHDMTEERIRHHGTMATVNDKDSARVLTLDVKSENTIDPRTVGLDGTDEMTIPNICSKECMVSLFQWKSSDNADTELFRIPITPHVKATGFGNKGTDDVPPCAYVANYFKFWRGSMQYRFMLNASNFHRGKLRFRYEPYRNADDSAYNVVKSEIIDLTECHDHKIEIGWGADRNYLEVKSGSSPIAIGTSSPLDNFHNGVLIVSVANELTIPDADGEDHIDILVGINTCEDIEFAVPDVVGFDNMRIIPDEAPIDPIPDPDPDAPVNIFPQPVSSFNDVTPSVFYYGWHTNNFHNNQGYLRDFLVDDNGDPNQQPPAIPGIAAGEYDDSSRGVVRAQLDTMLKAGITNCVFSWWGEGSREDDQLNSALLVEAGTTAEGTMTVAALYEASKLKVNGEFVFNIDVARELAADMNYLKLNYTTNAKWQKRIKKNGTVAGPVIFIYLLRGWSDGDKFQILQTIREIFLSSTNGPSIEPYIIGDLAFGTPRAFPAEIQNMLGAIGVYDVYGQTPKTVQVGNAEVRELHTNYRNWRQLNNNCHLVPTIAPGYNDRGVRLAADHPPLDRALVSYDKGSLLKAHLNAFQNEASLLDGGMYIVNSWNEWHEDTNIEPAGGAPATNLPTNLTGGVTYEPYGTKYVNIIGEYEKAPSYTAQSREYVAHAGEDEAVNEHAPETSPDITILEKPVTYHRDDLIFFGERVASLRALMKRYTKYASVATSSYSGWTTLHLPTVPYYKSDQPSPVLVETLINKFSVLFLAHRGSTRWKAIPQGATNNETLTTVALNTQGEHKIVDGKSVTDLFDNGWAGTDFALGKLNPILEWEAPYYSNERFHIARSLRRGNQNGHQITFDSDVVPAVHLMCAAGDDYQLFYFLGTPAVVFD